MDDIPKGIILVLLIITVLISVLGTWTVLDQVNSLKGAQPVIQEKSTSSAQVAIKIIDPNAPRPEPKTAKATGMVAIKILNPEAN